MENSSDDRAPLAIALSWVHTVSAISISMVLPGVLGYWADQRFQTKVLFTALGFGFGLTMGMYRLLQLTNSAPGQLPKTTGASDEDRGTSADDDGK